MHQYCVSLFARKLKPVSVSVSDNFIQVCSGRLLIKGNFEAYQTVEERVTVSSPSPLTHVVLGLKGEEGGGGGGGGGGGDKKTREEEVLIEDVTVYCVDTRIEQYFWLNQWLSHRREGQLSERVLYERIERRTLRKPRIKWQVSKKSRIIKNTSNVF